MRPSVSEVILTVFGIMGVVLMFLVVASVVGELINGMAKGNEAATPAVEVPKAVDPNAWKANYLGARVQIGNTWGTVVGAVRGYAEVIILPKEVIYMDWMAVANQVNAQAKGVP